MKLFGVQIANGFSPEARVFAHLLGGRSDALDADVVMHCEPGDPEPVRSFADTARCKVTPLDTGWSRNSTGASRGIVAKAVMGARYAMALPKITAIASADHPDIIYSCQQHFDLYAASRVADTLKRPQVIHLHYTVGPWLKAHALARLLACDHIITVSDFIRNEALRHGVAPDRVTTVRNAMAPMPPVERDEAIAARRGIGVPEDCFLFGIVSRLDPYKGHADTIEAFNRMAASAPEAWLVVVGSGTLEAELKAQAETCEAHSRIVFTGRRNDVPNMLGAMDAFIHPSRSDPCPLAVLEALASGIPVVAYAEGGANELVINGETGYLTPPDDPGGLAEAMSKLYEDPPHSLALGAAARRRITYEFRPEDASAKFEEVLLGVVGRA